MAAVIPYVPTIVRGGMSVGSTALAYARKFTPMAAEQAKAFFAKSGKDVDVLAASKSAPMQGAVVASLFKGGLSAANFIEAAQLTPDEARQYAQVIARFHVEQSKMVDRNQTAKAGTGNSFLDTVTINMDVKEICAFMGINSDQYAKLIRGINSHTTQDIETFQVDRRMRNEKYI